MSSTVAFDDIDLTEKIAYYATYTFYHPSNYIFKYVDPEYISSIVLVAIAVVCVTVGSYSTLSKPKNAKDPISDTKNPKWHSSDRDGSVYLKTTVLDIQDIQMKMNLKTTLLYPVLMSGMLYGMYYAINNYSIEYILSLFINYIKFSSIPCSFYTGSYILTAGSRKLQYWTGYSFFKNERYRLTISQDAIKDTFPFGVLENKPKRSDFETNDSYLEYKELRKHYHDHGVKFLKPVDVKSLNQKFNFVFDTAKLYALLYSIGLSFFLYKVKNYTNWLVLNLIAFNFSITGLGQVSMLLSNFKLAGLLLILLFFYDIYFVFKTDIMLTVATKLDVPMKFVIPKQPTYYSTEDFGDLSILNILRLIDYTSGPTSLLGLGDIVLPGAFISMCLKFDLFKYHQSNPNTAFHHLQLFEKPYFILSMIGYIIGLVTTVVVLHIFKHGQPALLYIVPSILTSVFIGGIFRGELKELWNFTETLPDLEKNEDAATSTTNSNDKESKEFTTLNLIEGDLIEEDVDDLTFDEDAELSEDDIDHEFEFFQGNEEEEEGRSALQELVQTTVFQVEENDGHQTDLDTFVTRVYLVDSDSDDNTFLIDSESDNLDIDISQNEMQVLRDEIEILRNDGKFEPRVHYDEY